MVSIQYSVVIPLKDEANNIAELIAEIEPVMNGLNTAWELLCIDDGSEDGTDQLLQKLQQEKPFLRVITFDRNYGQSSAFDAGFRASRGAFVITLDGDRQNDPQDIPKLLQNVEHFDLVCGQRKKRKDPFFKRIISKVANFIRSRVCKDGMTDTGCSLKVYRRKCLEEIELFDGMHRFLPALFAMRGFKIAQIPVNHRERTKGKTKYNLFNRSFNTIVDMWAVAWMRRRRLRYCIKK